MSDKPEILRKKNNMIKYMVLRDKEGKACDGWPEYFRPDCDRTYPSFTYPEGKSLAELMNNPGSYKLEDDCPIYDGNIHNI
jgi:hypothetical protein